MKNPLNLNKWFSVFVLLIIMSCSTDDEDNGNGSSSIPDQDRPSIIINADGTTSSGSKFVAIDANTFYIVIVLLRYQYLKALKQSVLGLFMDAEHYVTFIVNGRHLLQS